MIAFFLAAAAVASAPTPENLVPWVSPNDMPPYHQIAGITRIIDLRLTIRPDGSVQSCEVENDDGDKRLATLTCNLAMKRAKFAPAVWSDGSPAYGVYRKHVTWAAGSPSARKFSRDDLNLEVSRLPKGESAPARAQIMFAVDGMGKLSSCSAQVDGSGALLYNPELVRIACEQMISNYTAAPAKDERGNTVRSVQTGSVSFSVSPGQQ